MRKWKARGRKEKMWREKQDSDWCPKLILFSCGTVIYFLLSSFLRRFVSVVNALKNGRTGFLYVDVSTLAKHINGQIWSVHTPRSTPLTQCTHRRPKLPTY